MPSREIAGLHQGYGMAKAGQQQVAVLVTSSSSSGWRTGQLFPHSSGSEHSLVNADMTPRKSIQIHTNCHHECLHILRWYLQKQQKLQWSETTISYLCDLYETDVVTDRRISNVLRVSFTHLWGGCFTIKGTSTIRTEWYRLTILCADVKVMWTPRTKPIRQLLSRIFGIWSLNVEFHLDECLMSGSDIVASEDPSVGYVRVTVYLFSPKWIISLTRNK